MRCQTLIMRTAASLLVMLLFSTGASESAECGIISSRLDFHTGEEILLLCKINRGEGEISWQKDGEDLDDEEIVSKVDYSTSKVLIEKAALSDSGRYTCLCEFENGHKYNDQTTLFVHEGPSFGETTKYHEFQEGMDAYVPCEVTGKPELDVRWIKDEKEIPSNEGGHIFKMANNTLHIKEVKKDDAGTYVCHAQIKGRSVAKELFISVVVTVPPSVYLREEEKRVIAGRDTNVSLLCLVSGHPSPNITWTMPMSFDPSRHHFNSDRSQLTIKSVIRDDYGEYVCTAANKLGQKNATLMLHVFEAPEVVVGEKQLHVKVGEPVSVSCNVTGHPQPKLYWLNKQNGQTLGPTGRVQVMDGVLFIEEVVPSDGGVYSCMAVSSTGNASRDVTIMTEPGPPHYLTVSPGPTSILFTLKTLPIGGGAQIKSFILQWRTNPTQEWKETIIASSDRLVITDLKPYTLYMVRLAALNDVGQGQFSTENQVRTQGKREPDSPVLPFEEAKVEGNSFYVPLKQFDNGGSPLLNFQVRYKQEKEGSEWTQKSLPSDADSVHLDNLAYSTNYQLEVEAVNMNGSSLPATFNFTTAKQPMNSRLTKGSVVGIVMLIFLVVFLVVDGTCCYKNRCGFLMFVAVKLLGKKVPGLKMSEEGNEMTKGDVTLKGVSNPRGSIQKTGVDVVSKEDSQLREVTCDKAPLTKHEKIQPPSIEA